MAENYALKIRRYDPESGQPAYWQEFNVELEPERSVLDGILQVRGDQDGSLAIRCSCQAAICGSCGVKINGRSRLACNTLIGEAAKDAKRRFGDRDGVTTPDDSPAIVVEPMGNMPVLKDLIVDMDAVHWK